MYKTENLCFFNPRLNAYQILHNLLKPSLKMEQMAGIEPATSTWQAEVLPLYDICINWSTRRESNPQPADYKSAALPIEPLVHNVDFSHLKGRWGAPYAVQLTLSAFSLGSSITPNWHFTKVAKSLYKILLYH